MVQRLSLQSAGQVAFSTGCARGGVFPDVLRQRLCNVKFTKGTGHWSLVTRHCSLAISVLLCLLLTSAAVMPAVPSAPNIIGPTGIQSTGDVTVAWDAPAEGADSYNVAVYDWYNETWPLPSTNTAGCSYYVAGLMDNHGFIICLQAINADGAGSLAYSYFDVCSTDTAPSVQPVFAAPRPLSDADPANPLAVTFTWDHVAEAGRYWLCVSEWHNTYWTTVFAVIVPDTGPNTTISYGPYTFLDGHYYSAWLAGSNPAGQGPYNDCLYFGVSTATGAPDAPTLTDFTVEYSDAPIPLSNTEFEWSSTAKTLGYYFVLNDETANITVGAWWEFDPGTGAPISFNLPSGITLVGGHLYWFGVSGWNPWGFGTWATVTFVAPAPLTVTADAKSKVYGADNPALTCTYYGLVNGDTSASFTGALSTTATTGSFVGYYSISQGTLAATGYYYIHTFNGENLTVTKATPVITWANPADIFTGTPLGSSQLNATANVGGTFSYSPVTGTWLSAGANQTLSVTFMPTDMSNYTTASATVQINVIADTTPPAISIWHPNNGVFLLGTVSIGGEITDSGSGVNWSTLSVTLNGMEYGASHEDSFFWCEPSYLADGVYTLAVSVYDNAYNHAEAQSTFTLDTTAPLITSLSPAAGSTVYDTTWTPLIQAEITDTGSGVDLTQVFVTLDNGVPAQPDFIEAPYIFMLPWDLAVGTHTVTVSAKDLAGNQAQDASWSFTYAPDYTLPTITIVSPGDGTTVYVPKPTIAANISQSVSGVDWSRLCVVVDGVQVNAGLAPAGFTLTTTGFTYTPPAMLALNELHNVYVYVSSLAGTPAETNWSFFLGSNGPITISSFTPADGSTLYNNPRPTISANIWDSAGNWSIVSVTTNGNPITPTTTTGGFTYTPSADLLSGLETVAVSVQDDGNPANTAQRMWSFKLVQDTTPPSITFLFPEADRNINGSEDPMVYAYFADGESGVDPRSVSFYLDDQLVPDSFATAESGLALSHTLLAPATHTVKVSLTDRAGNAASQTNIFNVIATQTPQVVTVPSHVIPTVPGWLGGNLFVIPIGANAGEGHIALPQNQFCGGGDVFGGGGNLKDVPWDKLVKALAEIQRKPAILKSMPNAPSRLIEGLEIAIEHIVKEMASRSVIPRSPLVPALRPPPFIGPGLGALNSVLLGVLNFQDNAYAPEIDPRERQLPDGSKLLILEDTYTTISDVTNWSDPYHFSGIRTQVIQHTFRGVRTCPGQGDQNIEFTTTQTFRWVVKGF